MKNRMNICNLDLRYAQKTKKEEEKRRKKKKKKKTIQDYLVRSSEHKSTCSQQLGSSLQLRLMSYFQENAFVCCVHSG